MRKCLCGCGEELKGKQRMFHSDACRQKYRYQEMTGNHRELTANHRESPQIDRESPQIHRKFTTNHRELTNTRKFTITFTVVFASNHNPGEWDMGLLDISIKAEMARIIQNYLEYVHQDWQIRVKLESKPHFRPFD